MASKSGATDVDEPPKNLREIIKKKFLDEVIGCSG